MDYEDIEYRQAVGSRARKAGARHGGVQEKRAAIRSQSDDPQGHENAGIFEEVDPGLQIGSAVIGTMQT